MEADKDLVQNTFILIRMSIEGYVIMFIEIYIFFMFTFIIKVKG